MTTEGKLEELIIAGFAEIKKDMKELKGEMMNKKEGVQEVQKPATENTKKIGNQTPEITDLQDKMKYCTIEK